MKTDILIPLGSGSCSGNAELRLALRSIERYGSGVGRIWIAGTRLPGWLCGVSVLPVPDRHRHNKDANLFDKLLAAVRNPDVSERFLWWSDDQLALAPFAASAVPPVANPRGPEAFDPARKWGKRMRNTFAFLKKRGLELSYNWDSHLPCPMSKRQVRSALRNVDYTADPGYCLTTLIYGLSGIRPEHWQSDWKVTAEKAALPELNRPWLGYNDTGFASGLRERLFALFPEPCRYELPN